MSDAKSAASNPVQITGVVNIVRTPSATSNKSYTAAHLRVNAIAVGGGPDSPVMSFLIPARMLAYPLVGMILNTSSTLLPDIVSGILSLPLGVAPVSGCIACNALQIMHNDDQCNVMIQQFFKEIPAYIPLNCRHASYCDGDLSYIVSDMTMMRALFAYPFNLIDDVIIHGHSPRSLCDIARINDNAVFITSRGRLAIDTQTYLAFLGLTPSLGEFFANPEQNPFPMLPCGNWNYSGYRIGNMVYVTALYFSDFDLPFREIHLQQLPATKTVKNHVDDINVPTTLTCDIDNRQPSSLNSTARKTAKVCRPTSHKLFKHQPVIHKHIPSNAFEIYRMQVKSDRKHNCSAKSVTYSMQPPAHEGVCAELNVEMRPETDADSALICAEGYECFYHTLAALNILANTIKCYDCCSVFCEFPSSAPYGLACHRYLLVRMTYRGKSFIVFDTDFMNHSILLAILPLSSVSNDELLDDILTTLYMQGHWGKDTAENLGMLHDTLRHCNCSAERDASRFMSHLGSLFK